MLLTNVGQKICKNIDRLPSILGWKAGCTPSAPNCFVYCSTTTSIGQPGLLCNFGNSFLKTWKIRILRTEKTQISLFSQNTKTQLLAFYQLQKTQLFTFYQLQKYQGTPFYQLQKYQGTPSLHHQMFQLFKKHKINLIQNLTKVWAVVSSL